MALDRAVKLAGWLGAEDRVERWERERDAVHDAVLQRPWSDEAQAFGGAFGSGWPRRLTCVTVSCLATSLRPSRTSD